MIQNDKTNHTLRDDFMEAICQAVICHDTAAARDPRMNSPAASGILRLASVLLSEELPKKIKAIDALLDRVRELESALATAKAAASDEPKVLTPEQMKEHVYFAGLLDADAMVDDCFDRVLRITNGSADAKVVYDALRRSGRHAGLGDREIFAADCAILAAAYVMRRVSMTAVKAAERETYGDGQPDGPAAAGPAGGRPGGRAPAEVGA